MSRADGPFKIVEKINDNAYKLDLPADFGVSPTFNIVDLKPYLGEKDELESRTTPIQEGEDDEPIAPSDTSNTTNNPQVKQDPITRARARQFDHQVNSFLNIHASLDGLLLNSCDVLLLRNVGEAPQPYPGITLRRASLLGLEAEL